MWNSPYLFSENEYLFSKNEYLFSENEYLFSENEYLFSENESNFRECPFDWVLFADNQTYLSRFSSCTLLKLLIPCVPKAPFLYLMKTSENITVF